jgi:hypothetical protein
MNVILQGSLEHFRPEQLLSMLSEFHHTGVLEIRSQERAARVAFEEGTLIHADGAALSDLFVWPAGSFTFSLPLQMPAGSERMVIDVDAVIRSGRALLELYPNERMRLRVIESPAPDEIHLTRDEFRVALKLTAVHSILQLRNELGWSAKELYPLLHRLEQAGIIERLPAQDDLETVRNVDVDATLARSGSDETTYVPPSTPQVTRAALMLPNGDVLSLVDDVYLIGRDPESRIAIDDASVSRQHARLVRNETGYAIEDAESRSGTYVNGEMIAGAKQLANADVVRLGRVIVTFNASGEPVST